MQSTNDLTRIIKINKVMTIIIWVVTVVQVLFTILVIEDKQLVLSTVIPTLVFVSGLITFLHIKGWFTGGIKYIMVASMIMVNMIFVHVFGDINGLITAYIGIVVIALYQEYKLVVVTGVFCVASILFSYLAGNSADMLGNFNDFSGVMNIILTMSIFTYIVTMNSRNSSKILNDAIRGREIQEETANQVSNMLQMLGKSIEELTAIETQLIDNIRNTETIAVDVSDSFRNINEIAEKQNQAFLSVNDNMSNQLAKIDKVVEENVYVSEFTTSTEEVTAEASQKVAVLSEDMNGVTKRTEDAVTSIEEFLGYTRDVQEVLGSVNSISEQINLLALNASIEAARAGEHGRGFAVVAQEVGKLAEESKKSTIQIGDILGRITAKADQLFEEIEGISKSTSSSSHITSEVVGVFRHLKEGAIQAAISSKRAMEQAMEAKSYSEEVVLNVGSVLDLSERSSETVYAAMEKIEEQDAVIKKMVAKSEELNQLIRRMEETNS